MRRILQAKGVKESPGFIGLDEFSVKRRRSFHTATCDLVGKEVPGIVEGQGQQKVEEYLDRRPHPERVQGVAMDMHEPFRQARLVLPLIS